MTRFGYVCVRATITITRLGTLALYIDKLDDLACFMDRARTEKIMIENSLKQKNAYCGHKQQHSKIRCNGPRGQ